jgi:putative peptide zinc metalloprotease protein
VGEQTGTGFRESQWLIERDGRYLQVPELLYRILEGASKGRDPESIAAHATACTRWTVTAENVRELVAARLIPAGLVAAPTAEPVAHDRPSRPRSPLAVRFRRVLLGPRTLSPIADVLRFLFVPPFMAGILVAIALAHGWLYLRHGIGGAIGEALLQPGLLLAAGGLFVATTVVHELGHAAALRYGGGKVRGMGVGVYLVYPVFFTDTTDAYGLGRGARVRVDLGGFYFQSIASMALIMLSILSGWEWLLLTVFFINFETLRQLLFPFVRLDGYWLFADLTGIPDFFSQLKPFVRGLVPRLRETGSHLPPLKPLPKVVFFAYTIVAVPLLAFLLVRFAIHAPGYITTGWQSAVNLKGSLVEAVASGDVAGAAGALAQLLILTMPSIAAILLSLVLGTWLAASLWRRRQSSETSALLARPT